MNYSQKLKELKKILKLTTEQIANDIGIPARTLGSYERGESKIPLELLTKLSKKYSINPTWFSIDEGEMFMSANNPANTEIQVIKLKKNYLYKFEYVD